MMVKIPNSLIENYIRNSLCKGAVLHWEKFKFKDGNCKDSYFIVLTNCREDKLLFCRTTSSLDFYKRHSNLKREFIKIPENQEMLLPKETVIDLNNIYIFSLFEISVLFGEEVKPKGCVTINLIKQINKLVSDSIVLRQDWIEWIINSPEHS